MGLGNISPRGIRPLNGAGSRRHPESPGRPRRRREALAFHVHGSASRGMHMASADLSTTYLGLPLTRPFMIGASPLADHLDTVRRLEDAGRAAIVLHSLFEEQISQAESGRIRHLD